MYVSVCTRVGKIHIPLCNLKMLSQKPRPTEWFDDINLDRRNYSQASAIPDEYKSDLKIINPTRSSDRQVVQTPFIADANQYSLPRDASILTIIIMEICKRPTYQNVLAAQSPYTSKNSDNMLQHKDKTSTNKIKTNKKQKQKMHIHLIHSTHTQLNSQHTHTT